MEISKSNIRKYYYSYKEQFMTNNQYKILD